jgi:maleamate amidohydrolase
LTDSERLAQKDWWTFVPEDERALYGKVGYGGEGSVVGKSALLNIDITRNFTGSERLPLEESIKEFPTSCGPAAWDALDRVRQLLDIFRSKELPIVYTARDVGSQNAIRGSTRRRSAGKRDETGNDWVEMVAPTEDDYICRKARASAFFGTPLDPFLRKNDVQTVVVTGGSTSGCVRASVVEAYSAGFNVVVAEDAVFDRVRTPHLANLFDMNAKYATVLATDDIISYLGA